MSVDVVVIGGGLLGLATARALLRARPRTTLTLLEKEPVLAAHQSGRNSGVIHSGVYYTPGSAKARHCRRGRELLLDYCEANDIPHERCGKVVVAVEDAERTLLDDIAARGAANDVSFRMVDRAELRGLEPHVRGVAALHVLDAGIVDYPAMAARLAADVAEHGGRVVRAAEVTEITETRGGVRVRAGDVEVVAATLVACAGLQSDRIMQLGTGRQPPLRIVPFRGEYHELTPEARRLCRALIYPVPDPRFPFLGVHLTRTVDGRVLAGPNAVLALAREGYDWRTVSAADLRDALGYPGLRALARQHWRTGAAEVWRSLSTRAFARALQRMTPEVRAEHLRPAAAGVRAQALAPDGTLADDFVIEQTARAVYVLNAPSPAATASLAIGETIASHVLPKL